MTGTNYSFHDHMIPTEYTFTINPTDSLRKPPKTSPKTITRIYNCHTRQTYFSSNSCGSQRFVDFSFMIVLFGCWLTGQPNSNHIGVENHASPLPSQVNQASSADGSDSGRPEILAWILRYYFILCSFKHENMIILAWTNTELSGAVEKITRHSTLAEMRDTY